MTKLSVNINKIATLRNARGGNIPNVVKAAVACQKYGADGITVHPRPDERHIRYSDVYELKKVITTEFNIEGYPSEKFLTLVENVLPTQVTLVPDPPDVLTSNAGWDTVKHFSFLNDIIQRLQEKGIRVSIFIETDLKMIEKAKECGTDRIELYTEAYAKNYSSGKERAVAPYKKAAEFAKQIELELNAGHDLNLDNLKYFNQQIPYLKEVSIGHALISDALYFGLENTIQMYQRQLIKP
ncbi:MAG: pyridoxine 5'-phosphate synthase [Bacteroidetes bacterium]|nr:MAG: pyridoxine 5'-phosphate synthase [Bacteroidota bacterium]